jgi:myosin heavy subunit
MNKTIASAAAAASVIFVVSSAMASEKQEDPAQREIESLINEAAIAEKKEDCETAYLKYREAEGRLGGVADKAKAAQLESVITNKVDKVQECYDACQPTERQRGVFVMAREVGAEQPKRATQMMKRMLVGKNEKCRFWSGARAYLRTLPAQVEQEEKYDPCELSPETKKAMQEAREAVAKQKEDVEKFEKIKGKLGSKMPDLIALFRDIDGTRMQVFRFREEYLDCDEVYKPLVEDATVLKDSLAKTQDMVVTTYKGQVASLSKKVSQYQAKLKEREQMLEVQGQELDKLKKQFDELSTFNEDIFNDLFNLVGAESIKFTTTVEGQKIEQTLPDIQALLANEARVLKTIQDRYPEYFQDGINVEGLKRRKFVMEKMQQMMQKFGKRQGSTLGYDKSMAELDATIKMMDKAIEKGSGQQKRGGNALLYAVLAGLAAGAVALIVILVVRRKRRQPF